MAEDETVFVPGATSDNAVLLLAAVEELELDPHVVATEGNGFRVPKEVAKKAGVETEDAPEPTQGTVAEAEDVDLGATPANEATQTDEPPGNEDSGELPPRGRAKE